MDDHGAPDSDLVAAAQAGDEVASKLLFDRYLDAVYAYARLHLLSRSDAGQVTEAVFLCSVRDLASDTGSIDFRGWLLEIAQTEVARHLKWSTSTAGPYPDAYPGRANLPFPERNTQRLIDREYTVLQMRLAGTPLTEMATALNCSLTDVRRTEFRMLRKLRRELGRDSAD